MARDGGSFSSEEWQRLHRLALDVGQARADELADSVAALSEAYTTRRDELTSRSSGRHALAAKLAFFLPRDAPKIDWPLAELGARGLLPRGVEGRRVRMLDLGAGVGATSIGVGRFLRRHDRALALEVLAIDRDAIALSAMRRVAGIAEALGSVPIDLEEKVQDLASLRTDRVFDLVVFGFSLNELDDPPRARDAILSAARFLAPGGAIVVLEPALRETTRALMAVRDAIAESALDVFAPCVREGPCPMRESPRDWCHAEIPSRFCPPLAALAREAGLRFERLTFSYLTVRRGPERLAESGDTTGRIVSERLASKGKVELVACGDGGLVRLRRLDRRRSAANEAFDHLVRGDVVRWHDGPEIRSETEVLRLDSRLAEG